MAIKVLSLLKNWKLIGSIVVVVAIGAFVWFFVSTLQDNKQLESELARTNNQLSQLKDQMEAKEQQFDQTINNYEKTTSEYLSSLQDSEQQINSLQSEFGEVSDELQQCLNRSVPDSILDRMRNNSEQFK